MYGWMDGYELWICSPSWGLIQAPPPPTGEGTMLPTHMHLTSLGCTENRGPQAASILVCTNPAFSTKWQTRGKQGTLGHPPQPRGAAHEVGHQDMGHFHMLGSAGKCTSGSGVQCKQHGPSTIKLQSTHSHYSKY